MSTTNLTEFHECLRAVLDDNDPDAPQYEVATLSKTLRSVVRMGQLPGYTLTADRLEITPAIATARDFALLVYKSARMLVAPRPALYQFKTRALTETFGNYRQFLDHLEETIYALENGEAMFSSWQNFAGWFQGLYGISLPALLTNVNITAPINTVQVP